MKKALLGVVLFAGITHVARAQDVSTAPPRMNAVATYTASVDSPVAVVPPDNSTAALPSTAASPTNAPDPGVPAASPKYVVFGDRDDYRWQLGVGLEFIRFRSSLFDANMVGLNSDLAYFTNSWFAVEGNVLTGFGGTIYNNNSREKIFAGSGGIRIGGRRSRWEPWGHALFGGAHLQPQTADGGRNSLLIQGGGGVDYRLHARLSLRGEGDWVFTQYFKQNQNSFQFVGGVVFHF